MLLLKINSNSYYKLNISFATMTTTSELNGLDHSIYSSINRIRGRISVQIVTALTKKIIKSTEFEKISKKLLYNRINMLIQNDKIINRLNRNKDYCYIADNDFNSSITDGLPMTQKSIYSQFFWSVKQKATSKTKLNYDIQTKSQLKTPLLFIEQKLNY